MREDWERVELKDVLKTQNGYAFNSKKFNDLEGLQLIRIRDLKNGENTEVRFKGDYDEKYLVTKGDLLVGMDGEFRCHIWKGEPSLLNQRVCRLENFDSALDPKFLFYGINKFLKEIEDVTTFTTVKHLSAKKIKAIRFPLPPLPEQKRIVVILDEAFEVIDKAKENVERNIENAEELFQSKLDEIFSQREEGWITEKLSNVFKMKSGDQLSKKNVVPGPYPVYGGNGVTAHHHEYNLEGQQILIGRVGAQCGNIHLTNEKIWLTDNAFQVKDLKFDFDFEFLEHLLRVKDLRQTARQSAQPVISNSSCKDLRLVFPEDTTKQKDIAELINTLDAEVLQIIKAYKTRLKSLEELKKSILQRAFSGELTVKETVAV